MHASAHQDNPILQVVGLRKSYGPTNALSGVTFDIHLGGVLIQASHMTADTRDNIDW